MAYKRMTAPRTLAQGEGLTRDMAGIGMRFTARPNQNPNIEDTLLAASVEAMDRRDLRVLSVLVTWICIHHPWINADRLIRAVSTVTSPRVKSFWSATAVSLSKDRRLARLAKLYAGKRVDLLETGTDFHIRRKGEDTRYNGTALRVPAKVLRDRPSDVVQPSELVKIHRVYRHRVLMGPTYRADMWAELENDPTLTASQLARKTYGSFATAWQVKNDFKILVA